jgi:sulfur carrier protein
MKSFFITASPESVNHEPSMEVFINQSSHHTNCTTLAELLAEQGMSARTGIAVAVNDMVIPRKEWAQRVLLASDRIIIITATQGG